MERFRVGGFTKVFWRHLQIVLLVTAEKKVHSNCIGFPAIYTAVFAYLYEETQPTWFLAVTC